ncbi:sensor histidine kinase [Paenibacillus thalictri]|uniref:histidine kinase n=1 Tax=Paenibacillus thalictri TaxID=2527873 RepID=A0A4Q9DPX3_9BACL|nr:HAMP domain-containing sensor histidine kinase [Paenibacillus thalictri]TBL76281.1 HAMP domain-containing histidine kinase [Paenibacillus thalictri]
MFNKTRLQLVTLYSIVFFVLLNCFGAMLYFSTQQRLYAQVDSSLQKELNTFATLMNRQARRDNREVPYRPVRLMSYLFWDESGKLVFQTPRDLLDDSAIEALRAESEELGVHSVTLEDNVYRTVGKQTASGGYIQIAYNMEPERSVLGNLLIFIGAGGLVSVIIAVLAGYFLASRAFVPIQKAWEQQQQFVSDASHELRTPLSVLRIHLEQMFRHPERTVEQESRKISVMLDETQRLGKLVDDLLTLARKDSSQMELLKTRVNLHDILQSVVHGFQDMARLKGIELTADLEPHAEIQGDADRLHQLFVIVMDNALKYTKQGEIKVWLKTDGAAAQIEIADTGIGIAEEDLPRIFDRFFRADKVRNRKEGGSGLGLSIAKWIIEAHEGSVYVESVPERGTVFRISLPGGKTP